MSPGSDAFERALGYPYAVPERSFALAGGRVLDAAEVEVDLAARNPVLAYGSNAAPAVLARKLATSAETAPVLKAALRGFDVVYSAHISPYGAIPATLAASAGTETTAFVAYLSEQQLELLSGTEPNYDLIPLESGACEQEDGTPASSISAYMSRHGCLLHEGSPIAVQGIAARHRSFPAMTEPQMLDLVRRLVCPGRSLESFVSGAAADPELARRWTQTLAKRRSASLASRP
jgi:hypothetical protein